MTRRRERPTLWASAVGAVALAALVGCASTPGVPAPLDAAPERSREILSTTPISGEVMTWIDELQTTLHLDPNLGSVAIDDSRSVVTVPWFGEPSDALRELIGRAPAGLQVIVQSTDFRPADLQALVLQAMARDAIPGVEIAMGNVRNDASGIEFGLAELPFGLTEDDVATLIADVLARPDVPITVTVSGPIVAF